MAAFGHVLSVVLGTVALLGSHILPAEANQVVVTTAQEVSGIAGGDIQLTCTYHPHTSVQDFGYLAWSKDGAPLLTYACDQTCALDNSAAPSPERYVLNVDMVFSGNLTISELSLADEALYTCSVFTSDLVLSSSTTQLIVNVPAEGLTVSDFRDSPYSNNSALQIQVDQSYQLRCETRSPAKPGVQITWQADGIDITMDDQVDEFDESDSRLQLSYRIVHVTPRMHDSGKVLSCVTTQAATTHTLISNIVLDVQVCPSSVLIHECPSEVTVGDSATLGCRSAATSPPPVLYWLYKGVRVDNASAEIGAETAEDGANVLTYTKTFKKLDFGQEFVCCIESTSMCNQLCSESCQPDILYPPTNLQISSNMLLDSVVEGSRDLAINCTADGNPMTSSDVSWTRVDEVGNAVGLRLDPPLRFDAVSRSDAGMYRCTVDNGVGSSRSTHTKIIVFHAPNITNQQDYRVHGNEGDATTLTCNVQSNPAATITWYTPDDHPIEMTSAEEVTTSILMQTDYSVHISSLLHISNIDPTTNYGNYRCVARNDYGQADSHINLGGRSKPFRPTGVQFDPKLSTETSLTVAWQAGHDGGAPQTFTVTSCREGRNEKCTVHADIRDSSFQIVGLQPYSWYDVSVTGVNEFGESEASEVARNSTAPLSPSELDVIASYDVTSGIITVRRTSERSPPLPVDMCFHLKVKVIIGQREGTCLKINGTFHVEGAVSESQLGIVSCARGVCGNEDEVMFPKPPLENSAPEPKELDIISLVAIVAGAVVCLVVVLMVFLAWRWKKSKALVRNKQNMSSRKLPTLPRGNCNSPPSPSCQEAMEIQDYDGLELSPVNAYMPPCSKNALLNGKKGAPTSKNKYIGDNSMAPPSGEAVKQNHLQGTYTTTLSYLPMRSPTTTPKFADGGGEYVSEDSELLPNANNNVAEDEPNSADVATALLVDIDGERKRPGEDGYYSVPKGVPVAHGPTDDSTRAVSVLY